MCECVCVRARAEAVAAAGNKPEEKPGGGGPSLRASARPGQRAPTRAVRERCRRGAQHFPPGSGGDGAWPARGAWGGDPAGPVQGSAGEKEEREEEPGWLGEGRRPPGWEEADPLRAPRARRG